MLPKCVINTITNNKTILRFVFFILIICLVSSCAIHKEFPFICFASGCVKQQFNMKPFKKRMQIAINARKRKINVVFVFTYTTLLNTKQTKKTKKNKNKNSKHTNIFPLDL